MKLNKLTKNISDFISRRIYTATPVAVVSLALITSVAMNPIVAVYIDGEMVGTVSHRDDFEARISNIEAYTSDILGVPYSVSITPEYKLTYSNSNSKLTQSTTDELLSSYISEIDTLSVIYVDHNPVVAMKERSQAEEVLEQVVLEAVGEDLADQAQFVESVYIKDEVAASSLLKSEDEAFEILSSGENREVTHKVEPNQTLSGIATLYGIDSEAIITLNPDVSPETVQIGETIVIEKDSPAVSVRLEIEETYSVDVPFGTDKTYDDSMTTSQKKTVTPGVYGENEVVANVVYVNGVEISREILSETTLSSPKNEVVAYGTKATVVTGNFGMPVYGAKFSSGYGYRSSGFHTGIDLASSYGTPIYASDGGTVIYSGYYSAYGETVIIDHGNGYTTLYAHASKRLVEVGQQVNKGDNIALMGSTGNSTGNHLHFEVRINNVHVDPYPYVFGSN